MKIKAKATEHLNFLGVGITIGVLILIAFMVDMDAVQAQVADAGVWAPLLFILLKASTVVIAPLSGAPLYPIVGLLFGFWPGFLYVLIGDFIGFTTSFWLARKFGYPLVRKMIAGNEHGLLARIVAHVGTMRGFLHMCMTCFALPELISYGTGLSKLPYRVFISILWPLSAVMSAALVLFGSLLDLSSGSMLITLGMPLVGAAIIGFGGWLFLRGVQNKDIG